MSQFYCTMISNWDCTYSQVSNKKFQHFGDKPNKISYSYSMHSFAVLYFDCGTLQRLHSMNWPPNFVSIKTSLSRRELYIRWHVVETFPDYCLPSLQGHSYTIFSSRNSSFFRATRVNLGNDTTEMVAQVKGAKVKGGNWFIGLWGIEAKAKLKGECGLVLLEIESVGVSRDIFHCLLA